MTALFALLAGAAQADLLDFQGAFDPSLWTLTNIDTDGSVNTGGAPASVFVVGGNDEVNGAGGQTTWTIAAPEAGTVAFNWEYLTVDFYADPSYDPAGYILNGVLTKLSDDLGGASQSGAANFAVALGDVFGFYVATEDNLEGRAFLTLSSFSLTSEPSGDIPEPTTLVLVGLPLLLVGLLRRKRRKA
jgi:hypothetical protein